MIAHIDQVLQQRVPPLGKTEVLRAARCLTSSDAAWKREARDRKARGMALSEDTVAEALAFIEHYPHLGGRKGIATLENGERATLSRRQYDEIKTALCEAVWETARAAQSPGPAKATCGLPAAQGCNDVWASDVFTLELYGLSFDVAFTLDVWNTEALGHGLRFGTATSADTCATLQQAYAARGALPRLYAKSDNGSVYKALVVKEGLEEFARIMRFVPPGCPWWNGEAEHVVREIKMLVLARANEAGRPNDKQAIQEQIQRLVARAMVEHNTVIARPKNGGLTPAQARAPDREAHLERVASYREQARTEAARTPDTGMTLEALKDKAVAFVLDRIPTECLKPLGSLLSGRYRGAKVCV